VGEDDADGLVEAGVADREAVMIREVVGLGMTVME
jgi:hypothetical protein